MKMAGVCSQGLALPLSFLKFYGLDPTQVTEGQDVTKVMRVRKYVSPEERGQYCSGRSPLDPTIRRPFPSAIRKTDEPNVQRECQLFKKLYDAKVPVTITEKLDGASATYWAGHLASRNFELIADQTKDIAHYFHIDFAYKLREKMAKYPDLALQGEITGPAVNKNRLGLSELHFQVFNIWNMKRGRYLPWDEVKAVAEELEVPVVPVLFEGKTLEECGFHKWQDLMAFVNPRKYANGFWSEGAVCKGFVEGEFTSFKIVSREYLQRIH